MANKFSTKKEIEQPIGQDGTINTIINGKILKVLVLCNKPMEHVRVRIETMEYEEVINANLSQTINIFYPYNDIGRVTQEQGRIDYFYSVGSLKIEVLGMSLGDLIKDIRIIYE